MDIFEQVAELRAEEGLKEGLKEGLRKGRKEGRQEGDEKTIRLMLENTKFSIEKIAEKVGVSVAFVKKVKEGKR